MRKLFIILLGVILINCSGGGSVSTRTFNNADDLSSALSGHSFQLSVDQDCSSSSSSPNVGAISSPASSSNDTSDSDVEAYVARNSVSSWSVAWMFSPVDGASDSDTGSSSSSASISLSNGMELRFSNTRVDLIDDSEIVATGTWTAVDSDTIQIILDGQTITTDVVVYSDGTIELEFVNNLLSSSCNSETSLPGQSAPLVNSTTPEEQALLQTVTRIPNSGTWCFHSGTPYFLSLRFAGGDDYNQVQVALPNDNVVAFNSGAMDLNYTSKEIALNDDGELIISTESDVSVSGIDSNAIVDHVRGNNGTVGHLDIYFGSGLSATYVYKNTTERSYVDCSNLDSTVTLTDLQALGYVL